MLMAKEIRNRTADLREIAETEMLSRNKAAQLGEPVKTGNALPPPVVEDIFEVFPDGSMARIGTITE